MEFQLKRISRTVAGVVAVAQVVDGDAGSVAVEQEVAGVDGEFRRRVATRRRHRARQTFRHRALVSTIVPRSTHVIAKCSTHGDQHCWDLPSDVIGKRK